MKKKLGRKLATLLQHIYSTPGAYVLGGAASASAGAEYLIDKSSSLLVILLTASSKLSLTDTIDWTFIESFT